PAARPGARGPPGRRRARRERRRDRGRFGDRDRRGAGSRAVRRDRHRRDRRRRCHEPGPRRGGRRQGGRRRADRLDRPQPRRAGPRAGGPVTAIAPIIAVWLGSAPPVRSIRWLDGTLKAAGKFGGATAVAAGASAWLDLAADRALRLGLAAVGVQTDLQLDYLGWAQIMAGVARQLGATTILVDE